MASIIGKTVGKVAQEISDLQSGRIFQSPLNKLWRARIILNRNTSPMAKDSTGSKAKLNDSLNQHYAKKGSLSISQNSDNYTRNRRIASNPRELIESNSIDYSSANTLTQKQLQNNIIIINKYTSPPTSIVIQNRPNELSVDPKSNWVAVKSMGRNNPFMMYTGGEDTISFDVSWFATDPENRGEVIYKCRLLESWSRANGYMASPPVLKISWGSSGLFDNDDFILESAQYSLTHFQDYSRPYRIDHTYNEGSRTQSYEENLDLKLYPNCATQTLTFKRVSSINRTHVDIIPTELLRKTKGISFHE